MAEKMFVQTHNISERNLLKALPEKGFSFVLVLGNNLVKIYARIEKIVSVFNYPPKDYLIQLCKECYKDNFLLQGNLLSFGLTFMNAKEFCSVSALHQRKSVE